MKKSIIILAVFMAGFYAGTKKNEIYLRYKLNRLQNELQDVYSVSKHYEKIGSYIPVPEYKWDELNKKRSEIIDKMEDLEIKLKALKSQ